MRDNRFAVQATCLTRMRREPSCSLSADKPSTPPGTGGVVVSRPPIASQGDPSGCSQSCVLRLLHSILEAKPARARNAR